MRRAKIAVFVSGGGTNLQALIDAQRAGRLASGEIVLVLASRGDAYALTRAAMHEIPTAVVRRKDYDRQEAYEAELVRLMRAYEIDLIVLAGFMSILSKDFTDRFPKRILNIHPSLIPSFCGKGFYGIHVHEAALRYGVKVSGATVHFVNEIPDGGQIIKQKAVSVLPDDTPETLQKRIMKEAEWIILPEAAEEVSAQILESERSIHA